MLNSTPYFLKRQINFQTIWTKNLEIKFFYNIWKLTKVTDNELFKKLQDEIWEFRTLHQKTYYRLFAFWDKENEEQTLVVATHGIIKKTGKTPKIEIERAENLRKKYFKNKKENNENLHIRRTNK